MSDTFIFAAASSQFQNQLAKGRRLVSRFSAFFLGDRRILSLAELTDIFKPQSESYTEDKEIHVRKIIGSEGRSEDFAEGFLPTKAWMSDRWIAIWRLMKKGELEEPIDLIEYGGVYFVRDGNHRVSVAKNLKQQFLRARIRTLDVPLPVSENLTRNNLNHFRKMAQFHVKTDFFNRFPDAELDVRRLNTWQILETEINHWSPAWLDRHKDIVKEFTPLNCDDCWYDLFYKFIIEKIKERSLHYLYPGWGDTDVAMAMIGLWNSYPDPDAITLEEIYDIFLMKTRRRRFLLIPGHFIAEIVQSVSRTASDERRQFMETSHIREIRPEFRLPASLGKHFWRQLYKELFRVHQQKLKKKFGRVPYLHELVADWYDNVWLPKADS